MEMRGVLMGMHAGAELCSLSIFFLEHQKNRFVVFFGYLKLEW